MVTGRLSHSDLEQPSGPAALGREHSLTSRSRSFQRLVSIDAVKHTHRGESKASSLYSVWMWPSHREGRAVLVTSVPESFSDFTSGVNYFKKIMMFVRANI